MPSSCLLSSSYLLFYLFILLCCFQAPRPAPPHTALPRYTAFAKGLVDQMCAVAMERAGMGWTSPGGGGGGGSGLPGLGVGRIWRRGTRIVGAGGAREGSGAGGGAGLDEASRDEITRLHKDVSLLQGHAWQVWMYPTGGA